MAATIPGIVIDTAAGPAAYEQLRTQLVEQIESGRLMVGAKLPTVRALAADLDLATNTVARAYRELEADGYVLTQGRRGTLVAGTSPAGRAATEAAAAYAGAMRSLGVSSADALRLARTALDERG